MVDELLRNDLSTDEEDALDLKIGNLVQHAELAEGVLPEVVHSLKETFKKVLELIVDGTFLAELLVMQEPESVAFKIDLLHELGPALAALVWSIDVVGLEVEEIEAGGGQGIKWVDILLWLVSSGLILLGFSGLSLSGLFRLLFNLDLRLDTLLGDLDSTVDRNKLGKGGDSLKPGSCLGGRLLEAKVEDGLVADAEEAGEEDVCNGDAVAYEPVSSKAVVHCHHAGLDLLGGVVEGGLSDLGVAKDRHDCGVSGLECASLRPHEPFIDLGTLDLVAAEKGGVAVSEELGDHGGLRDLALWGLKDRRGEREQKFWVRGLVLPGLLCLVGGNDELGDIACKSANNLAALREDVVSVVRVDFHCT